MNSHEPNLNQDGLLKTNCQIGEIQTQIWNQNEHEPNQELNQAKENKPNSS